MTALEAVRPPYREHGHFVQPKLAAPSKRLKEQLAISRAGS